MSSSSSTYRSPDQHPFLCQCGSYVKLSQSWTEKNPGRRFYACPNFDPIENRRVCKVWKWHDEVMTNWQRDVILGLKNEKQRLQEENVEMRKAVVAADKQVNRLQTEVIMLKLMKGEEVMKGEEEVQVSKKKVSKKNWCSFSIAIVVLVVLVAAFVAALF